jgi:hypothetical protein
MAAIRTNLDTGWYERLPGTDDYDLVRAIAYEGEWIFPPHRFNLSVPKWLRWIQSAHDPRMLRAAAWHDHWLRQGMDRATAAAKARLIMREDGVSAQRAWMAFFGMLIWTAFE